LPKGPLSLFLKFLAGGFCPDGSDLGAGRKGALPMLNERRLSFLFLNLGHFFDHLFILIYATVAALALQSEFDLSYAQLIIYATPMFIAFGAFALPAGWLADRWS
ncbi:MAG: hypothetical protein GTN60_18875, partial [Pseudomonas stutzeri]|nr:hypothetical protein [Stutzerimonas stutzeri]NIP02734.1 hypothetical protein [Stutzerimonas stutzeri]